MSFNDSSNNQKLKDKQVVTLKFEIDEEKLQNKLEKFEKDENMMTQMYFSPVRANQLEEAGTPQRKRTDSKDNETP